MVFHSGVDGAGAVKLLGQDQARQLVRQRDAPHADTGLRGLFDTIVKPVRGADHKGDVRCPASGTLGQQGGQILAGNLFALNTCLLYTSPSPRDS